MSTSEMIRVVEQLPPDAQSLVSDFVEMLHRRYSHAETPPMRDERLRKFAGAVQIGTGADNESIDADLARAYGNEAH